VGQGARAHAPRAVAESAPPPHLDALALALARQVRPEATPVKVCADATLLLPLLVAQTFARERGAEAAAAAAPP